MNWRGVRPSPSGRGRREAAGEGRKSMQILRPSAFIEASPYRARASRIEASPYRVRASPSPRGRW